MIHAALFPTLSETGSNGLEPNCIFDAQSVVARKPSKDRSHDFPELARQQPDLVFREDLSRKLPGFLREGRFLHGI